MRIKRLAGPALAIAVIGVLGAMIYYRIASKDDPDAPSAATTANDPDKPPPPESVLQTFNADVPIAVEGTAVVKETLVLGVKASGKAASPRQIVLSSQVAAPVKSILVAEGALVQEGQVLVELDSYELQLNMREAQASLARAQKNLDRLTLGIDKEPDPAVREARMAAARIEANLPSAEIALERAQLNLAKTQVVAPFSGRVANLMVVQGQYVGGGTELLTIVQLDPIDVEIDVLEGDVGLLEIGRGGDVTFASALPGEVFRGRITQINPLVDSNGRMSRVTLEIRNPRGRILPGMFARANLDARMLPGRTLIPRSAIVERQGRKLVFVFEPNDKNNTETGAVGRAMWQYVATGLENDTHVELIEDPLDSQVRVLAPGEIVLTAGHTTLPHNALVKLVDNALAEGGRPK